MQNYEKRFSTCLYATCTYESTPTDILAILYKRRKQQTLDELTYCLPDKEENGVLHSCCDSTEVTLFLLTLNFY